MTLDELAQYIELSRDRHITVDVQILSVYPCLVRTISIYQMNWVGIEFDTWQMNEGGKYFYGLYPSLLEAISSLEEHLNLPLSKWENYSKSGKYPPRPDGNIRKSWEALNNDILSKKISLPTGNFSLKTDGNRCPPK